MPVTPAMKRAQTDYIRRNEEKGLVRINIWIPLEFREELCDIAEEMRKEHAERTGEAN